MNNSSGGIPKSGASSEAKSIHHGSDSRQDGTLWIRVSRSLVASAGTQQPIRTSVSL